MRFPVILILALLISGCKRQTLRPPSEEDIPPVYPTVFSSIPCYTNFTSIGTSLYNKRMALQYLDYRFSGSINVTTFDSSTVRVANTPTGLTRITILNSVLKTDSISFFFRYFNWDRQLAYQAVAQPADDKTLQHNQCYIKGSGTFIRSGSGTSNRYTFRIVQGTVYLQKENSTGKNEIILCRNPGFTQVATSPGEAEFTGRFAF